MLRFLLNVISETATILSDISIYLLFGFFIAGLIHVYFPRDKISKFFGKSDLRSVFNASIFGIPLPLCSCSVLPAAVSLRKSGASRGSVFSFLISTPETSVPSIGISLALLDPLMTIFRPVAAFFTAILAGVGINVLDKRDAQASGDNKRNQGDFEESLLKKSLDAPSEERNESTLQKIIRALRFSFVELLDDLAPWLVIGLISAGVISALIPDNFFSGFLGSGIWPMLLMLIVGIPLYVCAEGSTPIAATLILKGLSPGAAFVFLLAGPATNISSLIVLSKYFSKKVLALYLITIAAMALILGGLLNAAYSSLGLNVSATMGSAAQIIPTWIKVGATLILLVMVHHSLSKTNEYGKFWQWTKDRLGWSGARIVKVLAVIFVLVYLLDGFFIVPAGSTGMVLSFGKVVQSELQPGLHYRPPFPFAQSVQMQTEMIRSLEFGFRREEAEGDVIAAQKKSIKSFVGEKLDKLPSKDRPEESELLAGDENLIDLDLTLHYSIKDAYQAFYRVDDIEKLLRDLTTHHILQEIATRQVSDELTSERADFEKGVQRGLQESIVDLGLGVEIHRVNVVYGHPPDVVHYAFRDIASAMEDKFRLIDQAEADSISTLASARSKVAKKLASARTDSVKKVSEASGRSNRFLSIAAKTKKLRSLQQFRMNAEAAESTLVNLDKILVLTREAQAVDLILMPNSSAAGKNPPPEVLDRLKKSLGQP